MLNQEINIRDPFVLVENGIYYMYGTRAKDFGYHTGGFDVYTSRDLEHWSDPVSCFDSVKYGMNTGVNWAPEVHRYKGGYYMFATFTQESGFIGTYILRADRPEGPFVPHSRGAVTPREWASLDGTLYIGKDGHPYVVFCHEHTQIIDGTICYARLSDDLTERVSDPVTIFAASSCPYVDMHRKTEHYVTDGPFLYRTRTGELLMIWSSFIRNRYAELLVRFPDGDLGTKAEHLPPILDDDGGHGMIFEGNGRLYFTFHSPNRSGAEHPVFREIFDDGNTLSL